LGEKVKQETGGLEEIREELASYALALRYGFLRPDT
jgi:hypothetical protein